MRQWFVALGVLMLLAGVVGCSNESSPRITGYAVDYSEERGLLIVEDVDEAQAQGAGQLQAEVHQEAVWIGNLKKMHLGARLTVTLGDIADSYPALSKAIKTTKEKQPRGEQKALADSLEYMKQQFPDAFALLAVHSIRYSESSAEWEIQLGDLISGQLITLYVNREGTVSMHKSANES